MAVTGDFPPFYYKEGDTYKGISFEIVTEVTKRLGYRIVEVRIFPMKRLLDQLASGECDISPNLSPTAERLKVAVFTSVPHVNETHDLIVRADSNITFSGDLKKMKQYEFGAIDGWTHGTDFDDAGYLKKQYRPGVKAQINSLIHKRFDIAVNNKLFFLHKAKELGLREKVKVLSPSVFSLPVTIAFSKTRKNIIAEIKTFDEEIEKFMKTAEYQSILKKYGL